MDISLAAPTTGELIVRTEFGEILTNLDIKFDPSSPEGRHSNWTIISAKPGNGPRYDLESKFGKSVFEKDHQRSIVSLSGSHGQWEFVFTFTIDDPMSFS